MEDSILPSSSFKTQFILEHEKNQWTGGICLANPPFAELNKFKGNILHSNESLYLKTLSHEKRIWSYLVGRYAAKHALAEAAPPFSFVDLEIRPGIFYQPVVYGLQNGSENFQVSISHTNELGAAIAFPEVVPMGIDTELICDTNKDALESQMTQKELNLPNLFSDFNTQLTLLWTVKEALSKVLRCGLLIPMELLEVKSITKTDDGIESHFVNFSQFKAHTFLLPNRIRHDRQSNDAEGLNGNHIICSLVFPGKISLYMTHRF